MLSSTTNWRTTGLLQALKVVLILIAAIHYWPYFHFSWNLFKQREYEYGRRRNNNNEHSNNNNAAAADESTSSPPSPPPRKCQQKACSCCCLCFNIIWSNMLVGGFFGFFTYVIPVFNIGKQEICTGSTRTTTTTQTSCKEVQYAGAIPIAIVFVPILFMAIIFDTIGQVFIHNGCCVNNSRSRNNAGEDYNICCHLLTHLMPWRYGLMILYGGIICYASSLQVHIDIEENDVVDEASDVDDYTNYYYGVDDDDDDDDGEAALLDYAFRLQRAGHIALSIALLLWCGYFWMRCRSATSSSSSPPFTVPTNQEQEEEGEAGSLQVRRQENTASSEEDDSTTFYSISNPSGLDADEEEKIEIKE